MHQGRDQSRTNTHIGIKYPITFIGERKHTAFNQLNGKLARVNCFFRMIRLYIWDVPYQFFPISDQDFPYIRWIFPQRIA